MTPDRIEIIRSGDTTEIHVFADGYDLPRASLIFDGDCDVQVRGRRGDDKVVQIRSGPFVDGANRRIERGA